MTRRRRLRNKKLNTSRGQATELNEGCRVASHVFWPLRIVGVEVEGCVAVCLSVP